MAKKTSKTFSSDKPNIVMIGLGGTIAAKEVNKIWKSGHYTQEELIEMDYKIKKDFNVRSSNLFRVHSSDTQPEHWLTLARLAYYNLLDNPDGMVITHGTDTMHFTATALSFLVQNLPCPVVFTGSQIIPTRIGSDAQRNIYDSIRVAAFSDIGEVVIVFDHKIFRANRTRKVKAADFDAYRSSAIDPLGFVQHEIVLSGAYTKRSKKKPKIFSKLETNVALLELYPGMNPKMLELAVESGAKGLVLEGYGLGNYPIEKNSLTSTINSLAERGVPCVLTTQCGMGTDWQRVFFEEIGNRYDDSKVILGYDMRPHTALIKLMWVLAQAKTFSQVKKMMRTNYVGEITPFSKIRGKKQLQV